MILRTLLSIALFASALAASAEVKPFRFVHMSDTHIGTEGNEEHLAAALRDVDQNYPDAAFIIITGDITEFGWEDEFTSFTRVVAETTTRPVYCATGNHDTRWADDGKNPFRRFLGDTYKRIDHGGVRFILMDSAMLLEQYAHFDGQQLKQLEEDLKSAPKGTPTVIAMHHPPLSEGRFFDNESKFAELIDRYDVPLVLTGHGHALQQYDYNGTRYAMGGSTYGTTAQQSCYTVWDVTPETMTRTGKRMRGGRTYTDAEIPTHQKECCGAVVAYQANPEETTATAGQASLVVMKRDRTVVQPVRMVLDGASTVPETKEFPIDSHKLAAGMHQAMAFYREDDGTSCVAVGYFNVRRDTAYPNSGGHAIVNAGHTDSGIQSHPAIDGDVLYVGSNDGKLRAFNLATADEPLPELWAAELGPEVVSGPAVFGDTVVVGSMDGNVYALDKRSGKQRWKFKTGKAVFATPLVTTETVYIGSGDRHMYALDLATGREKWRFKAGMHIKATPALADGKIFFGAWDNRFYCLDANTGDVVWNVPVSTNFRYSAATSNPVAVPANKSIIVCSHDYSVRCFDQKTGALHWVYKPEKDELGPSYNEAVIHNNIAYFGSINGHVVGHDVITGRKVFDVDLRPGKADPIFDSLPLLVGDQIYVGSVGGNLYCVDIPSKQVAWKVALQPGFIFTRPVWHNGHVLVGSLGNMVFKVLTPLSATAEAGKSRI